MYRLFLTAFVVFFLTVNCSFLLAQSETKKEPKSDEDLPGLSEPNSKQMGIVDDDGLRGNRSAGKGSGTVETAPSRRLGKNGSQIVNDMQGRRTVEILPMANSGIKVVVTIRYGPNEMGQLVAKHPELEDYIKLFPNEIEGAEIEMDLSLKSVYQAKTLAELKAKHPKAFSLYRRYFDARKQKGNLKN